MTDIVVSPSTDLSVFPELEGKTLLELDALRVSLLGDRTSFDELSEDDIMKYIAICARMRLAGRTASKPAANGGRKKKEKEPEKDLDELLRGI